MDIEIKSQQHYGYIYKITNLINNKIYIGKHKTDKNVLDERYWGSGLHLSRALDYYGKEKFNREILCWCNSLEELNEKEIYYISLYNSTNLDIGYNIKVGGDGGFPAIYSGEKNGMFGVHRFGEANPNFGNHWNEESRIKMSNTIRNKGGHFGKNNPMYGKKHSETSKAKMREKAKTKPPVSQEAREKMSLSRRGRKHSEQTKIKMSQNNAMKNEIYRQKVSLALKGKPSKAKGKIWIHKETVTKMIFPDELDFYISLGYVKGRK